MEDEMFGERNEKKEAIMWWDVRCEKKKLIIMENFKTIPLKKLKMEI